MAGYQPRHDTDPVWFNGTKVNHLDITSTGVGVRVTGVFGWDDRPDVRDVRELRSGQDGEYADNVFIGGRTITLEGEVYGSSWVNLQARKRTLAALFIPSSDEVLLKIPDPATASPTTSYSTTGMTGYERLSCRVIEGIEFGDSLEPMCQTWQVVLRASDPRVYSDTETSTDSGTSGTAARTVTVDQGGTYETPPTITVTGPTSGTTTVSDPTTGLSLVTDGITLLASEELEFNVLERSILFTSSYERSRLEYPTYDTDGPLALWMLDEAAGSTADNEEGTAAYDGTYTGGYTLNQSGFDTGIASVDLNGSTGYVSIPYNAGLHGVTELRLVIELWIRPDSLAGVPISNRQSGAGGYTLTLNADGSLTLDAYTSAGASTLSLTSSAGAVTASAWNHVVFEINRNGPGRPHFIHVNGQIVASGSCGAGTVANPTSQGFNIGRSTLGTGYFDGRIAAVAVYDTGGTNTSSLVSDLYAARYNSSSINGYSFLAADNTRWANLGAGSSTYTLSSSGLDTGSKLNVAYRDARL